MQNFILVFLLIFPFLTSVGNAESPFEFFKMSVASLIIIPTFTLFLFNLLKEKIISFKYSNAFILIFACCLSACISYFLTVDSYLSFWGDKLLPSDSLWSILVFLLFTAIVQQKFTEINQIKKIILVFVILVIAQTLLGYIQHLNLDPSWWARTKLTIGTIGNTVSYATFLGCLSPFIIFNYYTQKNKLLSSLFLIAIFGLNFVLLCTASRTPILVNWAVTTLYSLYFLIHTKKFPSLAKSIVLLAVILASIFTFNFESNNSEISKKIQPHYLSKGFETRLQLALDGITAWKQRPIFGFGPETFSIAQRPIQSTKMNKYEYWENPWIKAHNHIVQTLVTTGLLGLICVLMLFSYLTWQALKIYFKKEAQDNEHIALSFYFSYLFLFVANLTCFNFVVTQLYSFILPILFSNSLNFSHNKTQQFVPKRSFAGVLALLLLALLALFEFKSFNIWKADILYQQSRYYREFKTDNIKSLDKAQQAANLNPQEPYYQCQIATLYAEMLENNYKTISLNDKNDILSLIDKHSNLCTDLGFNRDHLYFIKANLYGELFYKNIINDPTKSKLALEKLASMNPANPRTYLKMGILQLKAKNVKDFVSYMTQAIVLKADFIPAYIELVNHYYSIGDLQSIENIVKHLNEVTFYSGQYVPMINDLIIIADNNKDIASKNVFILIFNKYKYLADPNTL